MDSWFVIRTALHLMRHIYLSGLDMVDVGGNGRKEHRGIVGKRMSCSLVKCLGLVVVISFLEAFYSARSRDVISMFLGFPSVSSRVITSCRIHVENLHQI